MSVNGVQSLLAEMKSMSDSAKSISPVESVGQDGPGFGSVLQSALQQVNSMQQQSNSAQEAFASGESGADIQDVMMSMQKASLSFQSLVQVRNKLVSAYQEVMNMQV
ncbi:flagellar hook-basal body complex protein FliE [Leeia sp. TBRC 13508]|uniref:Flagellar hook-basal body complex protein FliE n=1 Tax=Leeia speluncae TaxID=2884804 RepID=A0ABS8D2L1_9NEIS|nr:flagellar hook-basal body complex protein FliE [Leeia speluncae]MCB6182420.1 flagellar hook-basal body complex protein FliE [Leeia speluncae]